MTIYHIGSCLFLFGNKKLQSLEIPLILKKALSSFNHLLSIGTAP